MDNEKKVCNTCGQEKLKFTDFTIRNKKTLTFRNTCKKCRSEIEIKRRKDNVDKFKAKDKAYYKKNKESILERNKAYRMRNRQVIMDQKKIYYIKNRFIILQYHQSIKPIRNKKLKHKKLVNHEFRMTLSLRSRLPQFLRCYKPSSTINLLGCSKSQFVVWMQYLFDENLTWENYGSFWHIDHVIPLSFFDLKKPEEQKLCFHWTNLRPLSKEENLKKSSKIIKNDICQHMMKIKEFVALNDGYQTTEETCWWRRVELRYGKNPQDEENFECFLKWIIRNEASETFEKPKKIKVKLKRQ